MSTVLLITGGSRGIGAEVARAAGRAGYSVAINYRRDRAAAERLRAEIDAAGAGAICVGADVSDPAAVAAMFGEVDRRLGRLGALVNSAGIEGNRAAVADFDPAVLERLFAVNVLGTMYCCREAVRRMSRAAGGGGGAIVNISSMAATIGGRPGASDYAASKAAVDTFTVGLAREVAEDGIRANVVRPGMTATDMSNRLERDATLHRAVAASIAMNRIAAPAEVAAPVLWLLSAEASFVSGACLDASGGGFVVGGRLERGG